jgi:16S rRNA (cytidine1402-2'-O)-methyltransferase
MSKLYIVPTPIGNLDDITLRAIKTLQMVDFVIAEDTRTSGNLMRHLQIHKPMQAFHLNNEHKSVLQIVSKIQSGQIAALVSDAGTPAISDPGFLLVRACVDNNVPVECLPGATALIPAVVNSALPCDRFIFEGFLPQKKGRQTRLNEVATYTKSFVLYESPHRLVKALAQLIEVCGANRRACVSRELSKMFEENYRGTLQECYNHFNAKTVKGEIVIVIEGLPAKTKSSKNNIEEEEDNDELE